MFVSRNVLIGALIALLAGILTLELRVMLIAHMILLALCVLDVIAAPSPKRLQITRTGPQSGKLGSPLVHQLQLSANTDRKIQGQIRDCWPPSVGLQEDTFTFAISKGMQTDFHEEFLPSRRGTRNAQALVIRTLGPLHLAGRQRAFQSTASIQVLPAFSARKHLPSRIMRLREMEGRALLLIRGQGTEFDSLREYVAGDDVRAIDWRSSARLAQTLVRTWRPERDRRVVIILDSGRAGAMRVGHFPAFDDYIETSLLLTALAQKAGDTVDVYALDTQVRARVRANTERLAIHKLATALADVSPSLTVTDWQLASEEIRQNANNAALVVILTDTGITSISDGLLHTIPHLARKHRVIIAAAKIPTWLILISQISHKHRFPSIFNTPWIIARRPFSSPRFLLSQRCCTLSCSCTRPHCS
ncbi:DUF58 domain-containing protein [Arcanobacterium hippocoleae]|uniref:DUF58 domain-containing protein n=1 Tax=Arcanobacterium hippocoleae TaxID=149017 RepID=UPI0033422515